MPGYGEACALRKTTRGEAGCNRARIVGRLAGQDGAGEHLTRRCAARSLPRSLKMSDPAIQAPLVSVLMVTYNASEYLAAAVRSVLEQTLGSFELVLVDNASTDGSVAALRATTHDPRLAFIPLPENRRQVGGWRAGLPHCRGEYVAFMDADDVALPRRLEVQTSFLRAHPEIDLVACLAEQFDKSGASRGLLFSLMTETGIRAYVEFDMPIALNTALARRDFVARVGFAGEASWSGDYEFVARAVEQGRVACVPDVLMRYRLHEASVTATRRAGLELSAALVRLRAARRRFRLPVDPTLETAEREWLEHPPKLRTMHRTFAVRALRAGLPSLAIFHARRARSPATIFAGLFQAAAREPRRLGFLLRLACLGPVRALRLPPTVRPPPR